MNPTPTNPAIIKLLTGASKPIFNGLKFLGRDVVQKFKVNFNICFKGYLERNFEKCSKTKTLLYRQEPVELRDFYVRTDLERCADKSRVQEYEFIECLKNHQRIVILGTAGLGKSTFCKSIFLDLIETQQSIIPVFIELRDLNLQETFSLHDYLTEQLQKFDSSFKQKQLEYAFKLGKILLILDGFDEVNYDKKKSVERDIIEISERYQNIMVVLSSRPDERFLSWKEFYSYEILPLDKFKAIKLVKNLKFDVSIKSNFLIALDKNIYEKHQEFAGNPLLLTMMLLTYEQMAEIPVKMHLFYDQAFSTLFHRHDAFKSAYKRETYTSLAIDEFISVLSSFCILSYSKQKYSFSEVKLKNFLDSAIKIAEVESTVDSLIKDLLFSVCILQKDGLDYTFTHRSFQEYFAALFLVNHPCREKYNIYNAVLHSFMEDNAITMALSINRKAVETQWVIPYLKIVFEENFISPSQTDEDKIKNLAEIYSSIRFREIEVKQDDQRDKPFRYDPHVSLGVKNRLLYSFIRFIFRYYYVDIQTDNQWHNYENQEEFRTNIGDFQQQYLGKRLSTQKLYELEKKYLDIILNTMFFRRYIYRIDFAKHILNSLEEKYQKTDQDLAQLILES